MADVQWIKIKVGMFDGESFKKIKRAKIGGESFRDKLTAIWFELMDFAGKCNHNGSFINSREIPFSTIEDIATMIDREKDELELCMAFFVNEGMVDIVDDVYSLSNWAQYQNTAGLDKIRANNRKRQAEFRERKKIKALASPSNAESNEENNVTDNVIERDSSYSLSLSISTSTKNNKGECEGKTKPATKAEIDAFFESVWELYPVKKGKAKVSDAKRRELFSVGIEEMKRSIDRYLQELKKDASWRKPQNGSTFFNSGYVDYLDANFAPDEEIKGAANAPRDYGSPEDFYK